MIHHITINDKSQAGKHLLGIATALSKSDKNILIEEEEKYNLKESLEAGLREVKEMIEGKRDKKTLRAFLEENGK